MSTPAAIDFASCLEAVWRGALAFPDLINAAEGLSDRPALVAVLYRTWLDRGRPDHPAQTVAAWFNLGVLLFAEGDRAGARAAHESALGIDPRFVQSRFNIGLCCEQDGDSAAALAHWHAVEGTATPGRPDHDAVRVAALNSIGRVQEGLRQYAPACEALELSLCIRPDQPDAIHHLIFMRQKMCRWPVYAPVGAVDAAALRAGTSALAMLNVSDDPGAQLEAASSYARRKIPADLPALAPVEGYRHQRIRVAYCSGDLCMHPVAMLTVGLFEHHDRSRFETFAFCWSRDDGSSVRQRILASVEHHIPVHHLDEAAIARLIREHEIDILIDLQGQTSGAKTTMLAMRPAPIQITYLGLPATTGLPCIDHVIADRYLIPEHEAGFYSEQPLYMPDVYQVSDRLREIGPDASRAALGLPEDRFVFCSFNNNHKYTLEVFSAWMNILRQVPDSVLWLLADNPWAEANLRAQAQTQGIDPARLLFAPRAMPADYLARLPAADLFLDTFPFNAGTTANDALWMGLPVLTMSGRSFAARMAGALLTAAGLPELITTDLVNYEARAVQLARNPERLGRLRSRLGLARTDGPLFDPARFTRHLEQRLEGLVEALAGMPDRSGRAAPEADEDGLDRATSSSPGGQEDPPIVALASEAEALLAHGDQLGAIHLYRRWLARSRSDERWIACFNLGALLHATGDLNGAREAFIEVLRLQPGFGAARQALTSLGAAASAAPIVEVMDA